MMALQTTVEHVDGPEPVTVLTLDGELDGAAFEDVIDTVHGLYDAGTRILVLELDRPLVHLERGARGRPRGDAADARRGRPGHRAGVGGTSRAPAGGRCGSGSGTALRLFGVPGRHPEGARPHGAAAGSSRPSRIAPPPSPADDPRRPSPEAVTGGHRSTAAASSGSSRRSRRPGRTSLSILDPAGATLAGGPGVDDGADLAAGRGPGRRDPCRAPGGRRPRRARPGLPRRTGGHRRRHRRARRRDRREVGRGTGLGDPSLRADGGGAGYRHGGSWPRAAGSSGASCRWDSPDVPGYDLASHYAAARDIGGDFFELFRLPRRGHPLAMVVADVTGKGLDAALLMAFARPVMHSALNASRGPAEAIDRTNRVPVRRAPGHAVHHSAVRRPRAGDRPRPRRQRRPRAAAPRPRGWRHDPARRAGRRDHRRVRVRGATRSGAGAGARRRARGVHRRRDRRPIPSGERFGDERLVATLDAARPASAPMLVAAIRDALAAFR